MSCYQLPGNHCITRTGYNIWIPKTLPLALDAIRRSLTVVESARGPVKTRLLYHEIDDFLIIPRGYLPLDKLLALGVPVEDRLSVRSHQAVNITPRDGVVAWEHQIEVLQRMRAVTDGVVGLSCGRGKTVIALLHASSLHVPVIVIVDTTSLLEQWLEEINEKFEVPTGVGVIQGDVLDWEHPIVVAMVQTLANRATTLPATIREYFGCAIYDEVHHMSAPHFIRAADLFSGARFGLSATPKREDGLEFIFHNHIGPMIYANYEQPYDAKMYVYYDYTCREENAPSIEVNDVRGELSIPKLLVWLGKQDRRNDGIVSLVNKLLEAGRTILILTFGWEHAVKLGERIKCSMVGIGSGGDSCRMDVIRQSSATIVTDQRERLVAMKAHRVIIATMKIGREGFNNPNVDTVLFATPFSSGAMFQQGIGRALRNLLGRIKLQPIGIIISDGHIGACEGMVKKMIKHAKALNYTIHHKGRIKKKAGNTSIPRRPDDGKALKGDLVCARRRSS